MLGAIGAIERFAAGLDLNAFTHDEVRVAAVLHELAVIGEAASQMPEAIRNRHPEIAWRQLRETRNFVTHVYFGVDVPRIWRLIHQRLPEVRALLEVLLAAEGSSST